MFERARIVALPTSAIVLVVITVGCGQPTPAKDDSTPSAASGRRQPAGSSRDQTARNSQYPGADTPGSPFSSGSPINGSRVAFRGTKPKTRASASDWRRFRGPNGSGISNITGLPTKWSATDNIAWKMPLPGPGASSPIIVGSRIHLTCYSGYGLSTSNPLDWKKLRRHLLCLDRKTGRIVWNSPVTSERSCMRYTGFMRLHGYASSTPVSDGKHVYVHFGNWGTYAFDRGGKQVWRFVCGGRVHGFGSGASPILHGDLLIVNASVEGQTLIAINKTTGKEVWRSERITDSWSTPVIVKVAGRDEVVLPTRLGIMSFDVKSGRTLWKWISEKGQTYTCFSLVYHRGIFYGQSSYNGPFAAIRPGGTGDVSKSHTVWTNRFKTTVVSPVFHNGHIYCYDGSMVCIDAAAGTEKKRVRGRPGFGKIYASPLAADGKIYIVTRSKGTYVFKATPDMEQIAHNTIPGDKSVFNASPVPHNSQLLIRSDKFLYCIGKK